MGVMAAAIKGRHAVKVNDFGYFEGPVVLFGGPYSNRQAAEAFLEALDGRPAICTGDVVAYAADPVGTVRAIRSAGVSVVAGNCERQLAEGADDCGCGFGADSACDLLSRGWYPYTASRMEHSDLDWMAGLPDIGVFVQGQRRYAVIHGGVTAVNRFLWSNSEESYFIEEIEQLERVIGSVDSVVAGHSGMAFQRNIGKHHWINAGAIGLPPHDGRQATRYAVLTDGEVVFERLNYDAEGARRAMELAGLTQGYHEAITSGIWPSEDVLPPGLRRQESASGW
ncbi:MAG: metallophosphoesterase [Boseongicola sp.]|nr:MAG: metallophosphoesterase [Boseongicola sp.]